MTQHKLSRNALSFGALVSAAVLFVAINVIVNTEIRSARLDLTANRLYTLSEGTSALLRKLTEPITLRFYYSARLGSALPQIAAYAQQVRDLIEEYATASGGKIRIETFDPLPFTDAEDRAVAFGLQGVPIDSRGEVLYFGLAATNSVDSEQIIPFFTREREQFLEYDLTRLIFNLVSSKKKVIGLISGLPLYGEFLGPGRPPMPWAVTTQIQQFFEIKSLDKDIPSVPEDVSVLMIVHARNMSDRAVYAIDQYILRGGRALVFVDPHSEVEASRPSPGGLALQTGSALPQLFDSWGIELLTDRFAGDRLAARRVNAGTESRVTVVDYLSWLSLREPNFNRKDVLSANLNLINVASAGILNKKPGATTEITPLIETSQESMPIDVARVRFQPDPAGLLAAFKPEYQRLMLAARIHGKVKTAFPNGPPPQPDDQSAANGPPPSPPASHRSESSEPANIVVIADTDILDDRFWVETQNFFGQTVAVPGANNGDFVINALDNLSGSNDLISLRTRGQASRPFLRVEAIQRDAELQFRAKERELQEKLNDAQRRLREIQTKDQGGGKILGREQQEATDQFRVEILATRRELRDVQGNLRRDIEDLEMFIKVVNIGGMPIAIALAAVFVSGRLSRRRQSGAAALTTAPPRP